MKHIYLILTVLVVGFNCQSQPKEDWRLAEWKADCNFIYKKETGVYHWIKQDNQRAMLFTKQFYKPSKHRLRIWYNKDTKMYKLQIGWIVSGRVYFTDEKEPKPRFFIEHPLWEDSEAGNFARNVLGARVVMEQREIDHPEYAIQMRDSNALKRRFYSFLERENGYYDSVYTAKENQRLKTVKNSPIGKFVPIH